MNIQSVDRNFCGSRIKIFIFQFAYRTAVGSVGIVGAKMRHIKPIRPPADLFIRGKADFQGRMNAALGQKRLSSSQNFRNTRLIVSPQQGGSVGYNQVFSPIAFQGFVFRFPQKDSLFCVQKNISTLIGNHLSLNVCAAGIRRRVHVGNQANYRQVLVTGNRAVNIAVFIHMRVCNTHGKHLFCQSLTQNPLFGCRGAGFRELVGGCIEAHIAQKAFLNCFHCFPSFHQRGPPQHAAALWLIINYFAALTSSAVS